MALLQDDGRLNKQGKERLKEALDKFRALDDLDDDDNENDDLI